MPLVDIGSIYVRLQNWTVESPHVTGAAHDSMLWLCHLRECYAIVVNT
jgi:hypothetical protein